MMMETEIVPLPKERIVALEGGRNFRDLGGYPTADGRRLRWGRLFRSGSLAGLTRGDWDRLRAHGVRAVCDFRTGPERVAEPLDPADRPWLRYWARDYRVSFAVLSETLRSGFADGAAARAGMIAGYRELPFQQAAAYRQLFAYLRAGDVPLVFNCAAGKDRAGTAAALVLTAIGVPRATVVEDYVLTNQVYDVETTFRRPRQGHLARFEPEVGAAIARADPAYIEAALDEIDVRCGDIKGYLAEQIGLSDIDLAQIRKMIVS